MLSIGFELDSSMARTAQWNEVILAVRAIYRGPISYDCGGVLYHGSEASYTTSSFTADWQAAACGDFVANVDFIGIDWYPPIAGSPTAGVQEMASNVRAIADQFLAPLAQRHGKPVFFAEIDYASANRSPMNPLLYRSGDVDTDEQASRPDLRTLWTRHATCRIREELSRSPPCQAMPTAPPDPPSRCAKCATR
jgi:hypothetical protein